MRTVKNLHYTTAIAISLIAISTANQAQAQCVFTPGPGGTAGDDVVTCSGTATGPVDLLGGNDSLTNAGATITGEILPGDGDDIITNNGDIFGLIESTGGSDTVINNAGALIQTTGTTSVDVPIRYIAVNGNSIYNAGTIESEVRAIRLQNNSDLTGGFLNDTTGVITGDTNSTFDGAWDNAAIDIAGGDFSGGFENRGTIRHNSLAGIAFNGSTQTITGAIVNSGTISGGLSGINLEGFGLNYSAGIDNSGTIAGDGGNGIIVGSSSNDVSGGITNRSGGVISGAIAGINVRSASNGISGGVTNEAGGVISGNVGIVVSGGNSISGGIDNIGNIEGTGGTAISLTNLSAVTPININGGRIIGDVTDSNVASNRSLVTITGSGFDTEGDFTVSSLTVNAGEEFRISTGDTFNTENINLSTGSTINFEVDATAAVGLLNVTAGAINLTGGAVGAEVNPSADGVLVAGQEILIGTGTADVIGTTGAVGQALEAAANDSLLFDFQIADGAQTDITGSTDASELYFLITQAAAAGESAVTSNANNAGTVFDALRGITSNTELSNIITTLDGVSTSEELEEVLQAVLPQVDGASLSAAQNVTNNTIRLVSDRLTSIRGGSGSVSGISSGDVTQSLQVWGQVFGQKINQGQRKGIAGYDADTYGTTIGLDTEGLYDKATVGIALSYANTEVDSDNATNTQSDIDSYNVTLYGDYDLGDQAYIVGDIGYTYGDNETTRFNIGGVSGLNAQSDYGSHQIQARAIIGRDYSPAQYEGLRVTPKAQVRYTYFQNEDIEETGAGGANLNIDSENLNLLEFGLGVDVRKDYVQADGSILSPEVNIGYRYDVIGDAVETTSTFSGGGPSFRTEGADPDQDTFNVGVGFGYTAVSNMEITASYDYESKDEFNSHSAFIRLAAPF